MLIHDIEDVIRETTTTLSLTRRLLADGGDTFEEREEVLALMGMMLDRLQVADEKLQNTPLDCARAENVTHLETH